MDEEENTRLVQRAYQRIEAGDIQALLNSFAENVQWQLPEMENVPFAGTWQGREGVRQFFSKVFEVQDVIEFEPQDYIAQGHKVVVLGRFLMRIKATRREFGSDWAHVWTLEGDKVTRFYEYVDTAAVSGAHTAAQTVAKTGQQKMKASKASARPRNEKQFNRGDQR
jgi:ketosteroid isomerase-like protein